MKMTFNKLFFLFLFLLLTALSCTRFTRDSIEDSPPHPEVVRQLATLTQHLPGTWQLIQTIRYEHRDTIIQEPTIKRWLDPGAKPYTTLVIDSSMHFVITQACMKCPMLEWKGQYQIEIRKIRDQTGFYMHFIDARQPNKKRKELSLTADFNGFLKKIGSEEFSIVDQDGCEWVYKKWVK